MLMNWDQQKVVEIPGNQEQTLRYCAEHFVKTCEEAIAKNGSFSVALSGGSTPKALFMLLTKAPFVSRIKWSKVHLFWSDERAVEPHHPDSNYHMAMEAGFAKMPIPPSQIHRMQAESDIQENALVYENIIKNHLQGRGFDLVMLGMGEDGHTASLFPKTEGLKAKGRLVIANYVPQKDTWRMSLTFECINAASHIAIYVLGKSKQEMVRLVLDAKEPIYPIQQVGTVENKALWILDEDASALLSSDI